MAEAVAYTARTYGTVSSLRVYVDSPSHVTGLVVGLYSEKGRPPLPPLTVGSLFAPSGWQSAVVR